MINSNGIIKNLRLTLNRYLNPPKKYAFTWMLNGAPLEIPVEAGDTLSVQIEEI